jgi:preprotein translocase subunit YajC
MPTTPFLIPFASLALPGVQEPKSAPTAPTSPNAPTPPNGGTGTTGGPNPPAQQAPPCADNSMLLYGGLFLVLMYFMVMRPEQKRRKDQQNLLSTMKVGDKVVTIGGLHGKILRLAEKTVTLQVDTVQMTYDRTSIARVERDEAPTLEAKKS